MMSDVVHFKKPIAAESRDGAAWREAAATPCIASARLSEIRNAQAQLKEDVRITVLMLDLAVAYARGFASTSDDSQLKLNINGHLAMIENLLELARQKTIAL
jgi:hypothetical protein